MERMIPHNIDAEQGVLGSILIDREAMMLVIEQVSANDFYRDAHCDIYQAMFDLTIQRIPPDNITVCDELERHGKLDAVGGPGYIASLINAVPTSGNVEYYAHIVAHTAQMRRLIHYAGQIAALAYEQDSQALEKSEQMLFQLNRQKNAGGGFVSMGELMSSYMEELQSLQKHRGTITGVGTGFTDLDNLFNGFQKTDFIVLAGRPGMGKTSIALNIAHNAARDYGKGVAVFSLEMGKKQLAWRFTAMESGITMQRLRMGWIEDDEWERVIEAQGHLAGLPVWINDTSGNPIASIRSQVRRLMQSHQVDMIVVDYLQLINPPSGERRENRAQEVSEISRGLKGLAKEFDVPVLALAQLSRETERSGSHVPQLSHLKESGSIEENADIVMFIYRDDYYAAMEQRESQRPNVTDIIVAKHRNGPTGTVSLFFKASQTKFHNLEEAIPDL